MRLRPSRTAIGILAVLASATLLAGCGKEGSSGTKSAQDVEGIGCAPLAGDQLVVLDDDKKLQTVDNLIPAVNAKAGTDVMIQALDKVSAALDTEKLIALNKAVDVDRKTPQQAADAFATEANLTDGITKGGSGKITVGAANFSENQTVAYLYQKALTAAGFKASVRTIGNRELYEPALERGEIAVVPEYAGTLTEFLNAKINGQNPAPKASSDLDKTVQALTDLGGQKGLKFGKASNAADQNAFAVTKAFADKNGLKTLSDFADKCSGKASVLGGPAECPQRPFCQPGLEKTYKMEFGRFVALDAGGPQTKTGLKTAKVSIGLVFSSDAALAAG